MWNLPHGLWQMTPKRQRSLARKDEAIRQARKDIPWLRAVPAQAAQQVLKTYHRAWVNCWEGRAEAPTFKKRTARRAVDIPQGRGLRISRLSCHWGQCWIPMVGLVRFRWTKDLPHGKRADKLNRVTGARLVREANGRHIVSRVQTEADEPKPHEGPITGIDRGTTKPLALSDGSFRRCSACGFITPGSRESQARFVCKADDCGYEANADTNAARNIEHTAGHAVSGRGDLGVTRS
jgi:putative transposase